MRLISEQPEDSLKHWSFSPGIVHFRTLSFLHAFISERGMPSSKGPIFIPDCRPPSADSGQAFESLRSPRCLQDWQGLSSKRSRCGLAPPNFLPLRGKSFVTDWAGSFVRDAE